MATPPEPRDAGDPTMPWPAAPTRRCRRDARRPASPRRRRADRPLRGAPRRLRGAVRPAARADLQAQARHHRGRAGHGHRRVHRLHPGPRASDWDLGQASEFLVVAATLLDLKAARLLPSAEVEDEEDLALLEARDLLFARLLQYRAFKDVAADLRRSGWRRGRPGAAAHGAGWSRSSPRCCPSWSWASRPSSSPCSPPGRWRPRPAPMVGLDHLHAPAVSVREQAAIIVERLRRDAGRDASARWSPTPTRTLVVVARFLALLELFREGAVAFEQASAARRADRPLDRRRDEGEIGVGDEFDERAPDGAAGRPADDQERRSARPRRAAVTDQREPGRRRARPSRSRRSTEQLASTSPTCPAAPRRARGGAHGRRRAGHRHGPGDGARPPAAERRGDAGRARGRATRAGPRASSCARSPAAGGSTAGPYAAGRRAVRARRPAGPAHPGRARDAGGRRLPPAGVPGPGLGGPRRQRRRRSCAPWSPAGWSRRSGHDAETGAILYRTTTLLPGADRAAAASTSCPRWRRTCPRSTCSTSWPPAVAADGRRAEAGGAGAARAAPQGRRRKGAGGGKGGGARGRAGRGCRQAGSGTRGTTPAAHPADPPAAAVAPARGRRPRPGRRAAAEGARRGRCRVAPGLRGADRRGPGHGRRAASSPSWACGSTPRRRVHVDGVRVQLDESLVYIALNKPLGRHLGDERRRRAGPTSATSWQPRGAAVPRRPARRRHRGPAPPHQRRRARPPAQPPAATACPRPTWSRSRGPVPRDLGRRLREGVELEDGVGRRSTASRSSTPGPARHWSRSSCTTGRNRVVRRMLDDVGHPVEQLVRTQVGPIRLGDLRSGRTRVLGAAEVGALMAAAGL